ncbi:MAG: PD-(D/E)XK nuclease family protein, partial [Winogradskyella sp.]|nr:PD-(D/E)XK nuclease family protein [Winogradskyella sp.]
TRAEQQLHILSKKDFKQNGQLNESSYASYFIKYLNDKNLWEDANADYSFGYPEKIISETESEQTKPLGLKFISQSKESHQLKIISNKGLLWDTKQEQAIERGNLVHLILSKIKTAADVDFVMSEFITTGELNTLEANELLQLIIGTINHAQLQPYFNDSMQIFNEKEIIDNKGLIYRLDRLVITPDDKAVIIDYKTGSEKSEDKRQILRYTQLIQEMGYTIKESLLVYINDDIKVVKVS